MLGVVMVLLPIVTLFTGLSWARIHNTQDVTGLVASFFCGPMIVAVGVAELRKAPPQYRLRTLFLVVAMAAVMMALVYAARE
jgi:hypothetical protein